MATLYELTQSAMVLNDLLEKGEVSEEEIRDAIVNNLDDIEEKFEGYAKFIKNLESDIAGIKAEEKRLAERRRVYENTIDRMKRAMEDAMRTTGKTKFKKDGGLFSFSLRKNPPKLEIDNPEEIPGRYFIPQLPTLDRKAMLEDLKADIAPPDLTGVAHISQGESISIR